MPAALASSARVLTGPPFDNVVKMSVRSPCFALALAAIVASSFSASFPRW